MTGTEPDILTNHGAVWLIRDSDEWVRYELPGELDEFIENLKQARDKAFPLPTKGGVIDAD
jgi:hypothetical protein